MKLINENLILLDMNLQSKDDIISCIADTLENNQRLCDKQQYIDDVYSREDEISTAMGSSIAIPHALSLGVRHTSFWSFFDYKIQFNGMMIRFRWYSVLLYARKTAGMSILESFPTWQES